jgi:hypothetical protein
MRENPHVQFDEGAQETCDIAARLCPTLPQPLAILSSTRSRLPGVKPITPNKGVHPQPANWCEGSMVLAFRC